jgi:hypothetical protein
VRDRSALGDVVVLAVLEDEERGRAVPAVCDPMGTTWRHGIDLAGPQPRLFVWVAQDQADLTLQDVEGVLGLGVRVSWDFLRRTDLQFRNAKAGALGAAGAAAALGLAACVPSGMAHQWTPVPRRCG